MKNVRVATVQFEHQDGVKQANLDRIRHFADRAAAQDSRILVCPECCITGYWFLRRLSRGALTALAEPVPDGPSSRALADLAQHHGMTIGAGLVERDDNGMLFNTYVVALPDGTCRRHRKIHCFISEHLASGHTYTVFDTPHGCRLGVLTCYDNNIGENVRITALHGAEILLAPHQTGGCRSEDPHTMGLVDSALWDQRHQHPNAIEAELRGPKGRGWLLRWLPARAHDNGLFLLFSNGVGRDDDEIRTGNAMVLDPYGRIIAETWKAGDDMVVADLDASLRERSTGSRWLRTRRPELYGPLTVRTGMEEDTRAVRFDNEGV